MTLANWIFGPQAIGLVILILGLVTFYFPSRKVGSLYGFRTPSSQNGQQTWDVANRYAALYCIKWGVVAIIAGVLINILTDSMLMADKTKQMLHVILLMGAGVSFGPLLIVATEKHLDKNFKE
jgi:uncharacterized membrane protein